MRLGKRKEGSSSHFPWERFLSPFLSYMRSMSDCSGERDWRARLVVCEGPDFHPAQYYYGKLLEKGGHHPHHKSIVVPPGDQTSGKIFAASLFQLPFSKNPPASIPSTPASHPASPPTQIGSQLHDRGHIFIFFSKTSSRQPSTNHGATFPQQ